MTKPDQWRPGLPCLSSASFSQVNLVNPIASNVLAVFVAVSLPFVLAYFVLNGRLR